MQNRILVIAFGNSLAGDDGVGVAVLDRLRNISLPSNLRCVDLGSDSLGLLNTYEDENILIIIDAIDAENLEPGAIILTELAEFAPGKSKSIHHMDPLEGIKLAELANPALTKAEIYILGIQIICTNFGEGLSPAVAQAVELALEQLTAFLSLKGIKIG